MYFIESDGVMTLEELDELIANAKAAGQDPSRLEEKKEKGKYIKKWEAETEMTIANKIIRELSN